MPFYDELGGNVLCLDVWRGHQNGAAYMHGVQFSFALGCFIAPIIAEPFLSNSRDEFSPDDHHLLTTMANTTIENSTYGEDEAEAFHPKHNGLGMKTLYPIIGIFTLFTSLGYLAYGIKDLSQAQQNKYEYEQMNNRTNLDAEPTGTISKGEERPKWYRTSLVIILMSFLFLYVGMEVMYGTFIATFAVVSDLHLTRKEAAHVNAVFWGSFTAMRFAAIFIAFKLTALFQLVFCFGLCLVGSVSLAIAANSSVYAIYIFSGFMGTGMGPIFACAFLWLEKHVTVTTRIGSYLTIAASIGVDSFPLLLGQFMATLPMLLIYLQLAVVLLCIILFGIACFIANHSEAWKKHGNSVTDGEVSRLQ